MPPRPAVALLGGVALLVLPLPALAIEPEEAADALVEALTANSSASAEYDEATLDGGDVVITGLAFTHGAKPASEGQPASEGDKATFEEVVIESPSDDSDGVFDTPSITFTGGTMSGESSGTIGEAVLTGVTVLEPSQVEGREAAQAILFETAEATDLSVARGDEPGDVTIGRMYMETGNVVDNVPQENRGTVEDIRLPPEIFADGEFTPQSIGMEAMVFDVTWDGSRDQAADTVTINDFTLGLQNGGELSISGVVGKLPPPNAMNDDDASSKAAAMEVHRLTIRYDDASLAGKVLDLLAQQQGIPRAEYAEQIAGALPFLLASLNNPAFQEQVATAVGTFLQDPQSVTVEVAPESPISGAEIMGIAGSAPQTLPDRLNVTITANEAE